MSTPVSRDWLDHEVNAMRKAGKKEDVIAAYEQCFLATTDEETMEALERLLQAYGPVPQRQPGELRPEQTEPPGQRSMRWIFGMLVTGRGDLLSDDDLDRIEVAQNAAEGTIKTLGAQDAHHRVSDALTRERQRRQRLRERQAT